MVKFFITVCQKLTESRIRTAKDHLDIIDISMQTVVHKLIEQKK